MWQLLIAGMLLIHGLIVSGQAFGSLFGPAPYDFCDPTLARTSLILAP